MTNKMTIEFNLDNAAFDDYPFAETSRILHSIADKVKTGSDGGIVRDINGNSIGDYYIETEEMWDEEL